jgi:SAM-dependent methyltransferase
VTRGLGPLGRLHRLQPYRPLFGWGHGQCIDRYYTEKFLTAHAADIHGRVLEIGDNTYTCRFGGAKVVRSDILHVNSDNPHATIIADLSCAEDAIPSNMFDCIILTQTLEVIYETRRVIRTLHRILKPGGIALATLPGIRCVSRPDMDSWGEYWRFTTLSASKLFGEVFAAPDVTIRAYGNVLVAVAFLHGIVAQELNPDELDYYDRDYEFLITARARKSQS